MVVSLIPFFAIGSLNATYPSDPTCTVRYMSDEYVGNIVLVNQMK